MHPTPVTIAVCTYRRNELLVGAVPLLLAQGDSLDPSRYTAEVLVIDNNPGGDAREVVDRLRAAERTGTDLRYVHQPRAGISAARNSALEQARGDLLAFIDDDEVPSPRWLEHMLDTQEHYGSAGVVGPILVRYEAEPDEWIAAGGCFVRPRRPTGSRRPAGHTSNLLLDLRFVRSHGLSFREDFGLTGGEDTMLTMEMVQRGGEMVWCDEAPVTDLVPVDRMNREWVLNRRYRMGISHSRCALVLEPSSVRRALRRARLLVAGAVRYVGGLGLLAVGRVGGSLARDARGAMLASWGSGIVAGAFGRNFEEYGRGGQLALSSSTSGV